MILEFKFKQDFWERAAMGGPNHFIKNPKNGNYQNFGIGKLAGYKADQTTVITDKELNDRIRRKQIHILMEYDDNE